MSRSGYVYLMTNKNNSVLYTGVTNALIKRVYEHKQKLVPGFTNKYNASKLVYYEIFDSIVDAITREKQIKGWTRKKKLKLVESKNLGYEILRSAFGLPQDDE
ncbi:MAG: GIY-YIG nuclease family protein [Candidatus Omnitrophica bacterium]|nr:GIY-YIG nuclease family protein [Candidatus Omnitrophota bacterium]